METIEEWLEKDDYEIVQKVTKNIVTEQIKDIQKPVQKRYVIKK